MTLIREERPPIGTRYEVAEVICDKCGEKVASRCGAVGIGSDYPFEGVYIQGKYWPESGNVNDIVRFELELCGSCSRELQVWVGKDTSAQDFMETIRERAVVA